MKNKTVKTVMLLCFLALAGTEAHAQYAVTLQGDILSETTVQTSGVQAGLVLGKELPYGLVQVGFRASFPSGTENTEVSPDPTVTPALKATMDAAYLVRMYGNRTHSLNIYLGAGAFGGFALVDEGASRGHLLAGVFPQAEVELFPFERVGLVLSARVPYSFCGDKGWTWQTGAGLRYLIGRPTTRRKAI